MDAWRRRSMEIAAPIPVERPMLRSSTDATAHSRHVPITIAYEPRRDSPSCSSSSSVNTATPPPRYHSLHEAPSDSVSASIAIRRSTIMARLPRSGTGPGNGNGDVDGAESNPKRRSLIDSFGPELVEDAAVGEETRQQRRRRRRGSIGKVALDCPAGLEVVEVVEMLKDKEKTDNDAVPPGARDHNDDKVKKVRIELEAPIPPAAVRAPMHEKRKPQKSDFAEQDRDRTVVVPLQCLEDRSRRVECPRCAYRDFTQTRGIRTVRGSFTGLTTSFLCGCSRKPWRPSQNVEHHCARCAALLAIWRPDRGISVGAFAGGRMTPNPGMDRMSLPCSK